MSSDINTPCNNWLDDVVAAVPVAPYYRDDAVVIFNADCREIVPHIPKADLLLTDPPYGIGINKSNRLSVSRGFGGETWDESAPDLTPVLPVAKKRIVWGGNYFPLPPCRGFLVWDKQNDGRDFADCEMAWTDINSVARILRKRPMNMDGGKVHPTQKPLSLMKWCIGLAGDVQTILDPFAGSGTTGRAAKDLGRKCVLIEREERYCEIAANRMRQEVLGLNFYKNRQKYVESLREILHHCIEQAIDNYVACTGDRAYLVDPYYIAKKESVTAGGTDIKYPINTTCSEKQTGEFSSCNKRA